MNKALISIVGLLLAAVAFVAVNILSSQSLRGTRIDLTDNRLYTLSPGTRNIARSLDEPIRLTLYFSEKIANDLPQFKTYGTRVREMLREYADISGGKIRLEVVDPEPFSKAEDDATQAGLIGLPTGRGQDRMYFGLVGSGATDQKQTIAYFDPQKEQFLEYDVTRLIYLLSNPKKKRIGVMSWLPLTGGAPNPMTRQPPQPWQIHTQLKELFDVVDVDTDAKDIPADLSALMIVHPKTISDRTQYAVDQYVLKGGRVLLLLDPQCDSDVPPGVNPMQAMNLPKASSLPKLLAAWGVEMSPDVVAADRKTAVRVNAGSQNRPEPADFVIWMNVGAGTGNFDAGDPITGTLQSMLMATAGVIKPIKPASAAEGAADARSENAPAAGGTRVEPLITTTEDSMEIPVANISFMPDPKKLIRDFVASNTRKSLAVRVTGTARTAFPEGRPKAQPPAPDPANPDAPPPAPEDEGDPKAGHVAESAQPINVIVVSDVDMIADRFWITEERLFGQIPMGFRKISDNGDFIIGALDQLSGSSDLISLRARGSAARPFELVEEIRQNAERASMQKADELEQRLRQTEQKINELQQARGDDAGGGSLILSPEQQAEIDKFNAERIAIRGELRDVQHQLSKDIERLQNRLKLLNIGAVPAAVALFAVGLGVYRRSRREMK